MITSAHCLKIYKGREAIMIDTITDMWVVYLIMTTLQAEFAENRGSISWGSKYFFVPPLCPTQLILRAHFPDSKVARTYR
jgi:hypothetical protein